MITDSFPSQGFDPFLLTVAGNTLYFVGQDSLLGFELYSTDGTGAGTSMLRPVNGTEPSPFANTSQILVFNGSLFFGATYNFISLGLWEYTPSASSITPANPVPNLMVYPNPFAQNFVITGLQDGELYHLDISDITGRIIEQKSLMAAGNMASLDLAAQPSGIYLIHVQTGAQSQTLKLVKE